MRLQLCVLGQVALDLLQTVQSDRWSLKPDTGPNALVARRRPIMCLESLVLVMY
jgi:hypothetical protein